MARVKVCPSCELQSLPAEPFCPRCGVSLGDVDLVEVVEPPIGEFMATEVHPPSGTWREKNPSSGYVQVILTFPWGDVVVTDTLFVGRDSEFSTIANHINSAGLDWVSGRHAEIFVEEVQLFVRDLGSTNGTFVNDQPIASLQPVQVRDGDRIAFSRRLSATVRLQ